jgi:hypothetical protein
LRADNWFEAFDRLHGHRHFALEGLLFLLTDPLLAIHPGWKRTPPAQKDIQPREQAVPGHHFLDRIEKMTAQAIHFSPFWLLMNRVVQDQETCHYGLLGTPDPYRLFGFQVSMFCLDLPFQSLSKVAHPSPSSFFWRPGPLVQKPRKTRKADPLTNHSQQSAHRFPFFAFHQPQEYDHEVHPLTLTETGTVDVYILAQWLRKAYNWFGQASPPGFGSRQTTISGIYTMFSIQVLSMQR